MTHLILASGSKIRSDLLRNAGVSISTEIARVDEDAIKEAMLAENAKPRDLADALAETKARRISAKHPGSLVLGCDQILEQKGVVYSKPQTPEDAIAQLNMLRGQTHALLSAAVIYENDRPIWRHVSVARLTMRDASSEYIEDYVKRNWDSIKHSVGAYKLEEEGVRFFSRIEGDYFTILGLPLLEILSYLTLRGTLPS